MSRSYAAKLWFYSSFILGFAHVALAAGPDPDPSPKYGPASGLYLSFGGGFSHLQDSSVRGEGTRYRNDYGLGPVGYGAVGYSLGVFRVESEFAFRNNDGRGVANARDRQQGGARAYTFMANALFEPFPQWRLSPYIGGGAGLGVIDQDRQRFSRSGGIGENAYQDRYTVASDTDARFAYQGIAGARLHLSDQWSVQADYRYLATLDPDVSVRRTRTNAAGVTRESNDADTDYRNHALTIGLTYHFGAADTAPEPTGSAPAAVRPAAASAPLPKADPPPAPTPPRPTEEQYVIFFAFDKSDITPDSAKILDRAVAQFRTTGQVKVRIDGHTDRAGPNHYNERLSQRRAKAVADYMINRGVPSSDITMEGFGETQPKIPTKDGVREQQNRRAEIYIR